MSAASKTVFIDRYNRIVEGPAAPAPWLAVVADTEMAVPAGTCVTGTVMAETTRSGPTRTVELNFVLFVSLVSVNALAPSACAST